MSLAKAIPIKTKQGETIDLVDMCQSLGGSIYGTTPGGTRRVYRRDMLLSLRNTPETTIKPFNLPIIPGVTKEKAEDNVPEVRANEVGTEEDFDDDELERRAIQAHHNMSSSSSSSSHNDLDDDDEKNSSMNGGGSGSGSSGGDDELFEME